MVKISYVMAAVYLACLSIVDVRKKRVSWIVLAAGGSILFAGCVLTGRIQLWSSLGGVAIGGALLLVSLITKEAIGRADCILVMLLGGCFGAAQCSILLCIGFVLCCLYCMTGLVLRKWTRKHRVAFIPFMFAGYLCSSMELWLRG